MGHADNSRPTDTHVNALDHVLTDYTSIAHISRTPVVILRLETPFDQAANLKCDGCVKTVDRGTMPTKPRSYL